MEEFLNAVELKGNVRDDGPGFFQYLQRNLYPAFLFYGFISASASLFTS